LWVSEILTKESLKGAIICDIPYFFTVWCTVHRIQLSSELNKFLIAEVCLACINFTLRYKVGLLVSTNLTFGKLFLSYWITE